MVELWDEQLMLAKYHLSIAKRLFENFSDYETKRFLSGCLNELAFCCTGFVNASLIYCHVKDGIKISKKPKDRIKMFRKYGKDLFDKSVVKNVFDVFNICRAKKDSPIELLRGDKIILLDKGEYRALTLIRIGELIKKTEEGIKNFPKN